ncbi:exonuclease domain-containing protein [Paraferrimonas haliotis]|uniref:DNA polymerase III subunit epsilon n=1 Tax=Paraferrimonas haliotis TaxID=2013866 RepID=A0AA37TK39_9GAMM|nr:exonuclease domain-containing protein [Paraferrimonas haliotis]GLS82679.1 DNA polymerase III subunit epsilon [Paraferrimonas haliotis]
MTRLYWMWQHFQAQRRWHKALMQGLKDNWDKPINEARLVCFDMEMTGLNPKCDQIVSIGCVVIEHGALQMGQADHIFLRINGSVGQSAVIHKIHDHHLDNALSPQQAFAWWCQKMEGSVAVAHHGKLDFSFLSMLAKELDGEGFKLPWIDTLLLEKHRLDRSERPIMNGDLTLAESRRRYHLPEFSAHSALSDALACGELLLAQIACQGAQTHKVHQFLRG